MSESYREQMIVWERIGIEVRNDLMEAAYDMSNEPSDFGGAEDHFKASVERVDKYVPRFRKCSQEFAAIRAGAAALSPPPEFKSIHEFFLNGCDEYVTNIEKIIRGLALIREGDPEKLDEVVELVSGTLQELAKPHILFKHHLG